MTCYDRGSSVENDMRAAIERAKSKGIVLDFRDHTCSMSHPDFWVLFNPDKIDVRGLSARDVSLVIEAARPGVWFEGKSRKKYNMSNWSWFEKMNVSRDDAFVEDDLTIRRLEWYGHGINKYLVVGADDGRIVVYPAAVLNRLQQIRMANREQVGFPVPKGKWMMSLAWGVQCRSMDHVLVSALSAYRQGAQWAGVLESVSAPINIEGINDFQGIPRTQDHRMTDLEDK